MKRRNYILWKKKTDLQKALEYEADLQRKGLLKDLKTYVAMLDEYAAIRGYWNFDEMINELVQDGQ